MYIVCLHGKSILKCIWLYAADIIKTSKFLRLSQHQHTNKIITSAVGCPLGIFSVFVVCWSFSKSTFSKNSFINMIRVSNSLDPNQAQRSVGPDLGPNCLTLKLSDLVYRPKYTWSVYHLSTRRYVSVHESSGETLKVRKLIWVVAHAISDKISCTDTYLHVDKWYTLQIYLGW